MSGRWSREGLLAFADCAIAQRRHLDVTWRDAIITAWRYGPTQRTPKTPDA